MFLKELSNTRREKLSKELSVRVFSRILSFMYLSQNPAEGAETGHGAFKRFCREQIL